MCRNREFFKLCDLQVLAVLAELVAFFGCLSRLSGWYAHDGRLELLVHGAPHNVHAS